MGHKNKKLQAALLKAREQDPKRLFQQLPKPKKNEDGTCSCGCCHLPDHGPCPKYIPGANKRCAVCDHGILCHRRKGEKPPADWNCPVGLPVPRTDVLPPSRKECPACGVVMLRCQKCAQFIPLKSSDSGYHIAHCPTHGHFDIACPKAKHE